MMKPGGWYKLTLVASGKTQLSLPHFPLCKSSGTPVHTEANGHTKFVWSSATPQKHMCNLRSLYLPLLPILKISHIYSFYENVLHFAVCGKFYDPQCSSAAFFG